VLYNRMFTMKTTPQWLGMLGDLAQAANRKRCDYLRDLINLLHTNQNARQTITEYLRGAYAGNH